MKIILNVFAFFAILLSLNVIGQTNTINDGNWTAGANWTAGVPTRTGIASISHHMILNKDIEIKNSGHYIITSSGSLRGGSSYKIELKDHAKLDVNGPLSIKDDLKQKDDSEVNINAPVEIKDDFKSEDDSKIIINSNVHVKGEFEMEGNSTLTIKSGDTLTVKDKVVLEGNVKIIVEKDAVFINKGDLEIKNKVDITLDGTMYVHGESKIEDKVVIDGNGSFEGKGEVEIEKSASVFGGHKNCNSKCKYGQGFGLPIVLKSFTARINDNNANVVMVDWTTISEINNNYFNLEHSVDGAPFEIVAKIDGAGNSNKKLIYKKEIQIKKRGTHYFKLTQVDFDGESESFRPISIENDRKQTNTFDKINAYPNPSNGENISLNINEISAGNYTLFLFDGKGSKVLYNEFKVGDEQSIYMDNLMQGKRLTKGIYFLTIQSSSTKLSQRLIVQ